jgi:CRP-like cAMP-binding protein
MPFRLVPRRDRKLNRLVKRGDVRTLRRGEVLYQAGDPVDDAFLVRSGHVRLWQATDTDGARRRTVEVIGPREIFGIEPAFAGPGVRRSFGATAGESTVLVTLEGASLGRTLRTAEKTFAQLLRSGHEDLARARQRGAGRGGPRTPQRLAEVLLDLTRRFGTESGTGMLIPLRLTHGELADLAGAHRSTVTTLLNDWIYRSALRDRPDGLLVYPDRLRKRASGASASQASGRAGRRERSAPDVDRSNT